MAPDMAPLAHAAMDVFQRQADAGADADAQAGTARDRGGPALLCVFIAARQM